MGAVALIWIAAICAAAVVAERKGRSGTRWAVATALVGPLAFVVLLCADSVPQPPSCPRLQIEVEITLRLCPECRSLLPSESTACPSCGGSMS